ncbi:MAG: hypothetical protein K2X38_24140 [Gemmataceae bacterium]|nr:hypothetical protein [Gemmataceae bacterium]
MSQSTVSVSIPGATASRSKMQKKGWKCWAKWITKVASPARDGYSYDGEFTEVDGTVECQVGDVLLHVDGSHAATIRVVVINSEGKGRLISVAVADSTKWAGTLGGPARKVLAMDAEERVRYAARHFVETAEDLKPEVRAYYEKLAGIAVVAAESEPRRP